MIDQRKEYVVQCILSVLNIPLQEFRSNTASNAVLEKFLDDPKCKVLQAIETPQGDKAGKPSRTVTCAIGFSNYAEACNEVHFIRTSPEPLTEENVSSQVLVSSLRFSAVRSLFYSLREVYVPLLMEASDASGTDKLEGRLSECLGELEAGLSASLRRGLRKQEKGFDEKDVRGILTPSDEVRFWDEYSSASGVGDAAKDRASELSSALSPVASDLTGIESKSFAQLLDLVEALNDALENLWSCEVSPWYPQSRMLHFIKTIAGAIGRTVQAQLNALNIWDNSLADVAAKVREGWKVCEKFNEMTYDLTGVQWRHAENQWKGEGYKDQFLLNTAIRIREVHQIRSQHDQILALLPVEERRLLQVDMCFEPFKKMLAFSYNDYTVPKWKETVAEYESLMMPVEAKIADLLRNELVTDRSNPAQSVRVFQKYQDLLERKGLREALRIERERLLTELDEFLNRLQQELDTFDAENSLPAGRGLSVSARKMMWIEHLKSKASLAERPLSGFLKDLPKARDVGQTCKKVLQELKEQRKKQFEEWTREIDSELKDGELALEMNGRVMEFDASQSLRITYSERLIQLVKEARLFEQMTFKIPDKINNVVKDGLKFYRFAVQLKQICNIHNNMDSELLQSQRRMVLQPALAFEKHFTETKEMNKMKWDNLAGLETFTMNVKASAENLRTVNRLLRSGHSQVASEVVQLSNLSLLRQREQWKQKIAQIKTVMTSTITQCKCEEEDALPWKRHWDFQIFKIMEIQYRFGLESLNEHLPEVEAELKQSGFEPPLCDLKLNYYKEIKSFISRPMSFKGLEGAPKIYRAMPTRNSEGVAVVFQKADELFLKLQKLQESFTPWHVIDFLPKRMQELVDQLQETKDWELNLRSIKAKQKEMDKIPDTIKIDCFTIRTMKMKRSIEEQLDRLRLDLVAGLKRQVTNEVQAVKTFLEDAFVKLDVKPNSVTELTEAQNEVAKLKEMQPQMKKQLDIADEKNKLLRSVGPAVDLEEVSGKFSEFINYIESFEQEAGKLREDLKSKMDQRIANSKVEIEKFASNWQACKPKVAAKCSIEEAKTNAAEMQNWLDQWEQLKQDITGLKGDCEEFGMEMPPLTEIDAVEEDLTAQQQSWTFFEQFATQLDELLQQTWLSLRPRLFTLQDLSSEWLGKLKEVKRDEITHMLASQVQQLNAGFTGLKNMTGEPFEREHWKACFTKIGLPTDTRLDALTFGMLFDRLPLIIEKADELKELTARAVGEVTIREAVMEVSVWFEQTDFSMMDHPVRGGVVPLVKDWKDLLSEVSDKQSLCGSLKDSRFYAPFKDQVDKFEEKFGILDELLLTMNKVQRKWVYLEPIFGRGSLPREKERFDKVNNMFRQNMKNIGQNKKVNFVCTQKGLKDQFVHMADQLDRCQKALTSFLEEKRSAFPRLYFIGDEDLLEILGQSSNPEVIQSHLKKLFAGIATVDFGEGGMEILGMNSSLGEKVMLRNPVRVKEDADNPRNVEEWLSDLSTAMVSTLAADLQPCCKPEEVNLEYIEQYPSQLLCLAESIRFTQNVEKSIQQGSLQPLKEELAQQLSMMTSVPMDSALMSAKLKSMILDLIHNIAVLDTLIQKGGKLQSMSDWEWFKQLRYYSKFGEKNPCIVRMLECEQFYSFEYQGNAGKLVHTPLTDKCYLTLMHGLHLGYGGNPYGPAGTGKTESVKALGSCLGRQVLVFNCDEGIDFQAMNRIFIGLVRCGAWGCFDEFNRLLEEQMSAISQSIQLIQAAIKGHSSQVHLLGRDVAVNHNAGIFITMNPATKGYGGRQKLPDNLKQLFRPVAMSVPDNELIAEVMMFAEGFLYAPKLAQKVVALFVLSRQLLSLQQHYNWGLRELKPILNLAGRLLQDAKVAASAPLSEVDEGVLLLKAVRMNVLSKLTFADSRRFQDICQDLFPGVSVNDIEYKDLEEVIRETMQSLGLSAISAQISKMLQFHEACQQRMGVGIIGPSGCGKSTMWKVLEAAYKKMGKTYVVHVMNPKAISRVRLLGHMDHDTREWFDGVLTASARKVIKEPVTTHNWIVCDGDIDPEWVESLNSVLDDNRLLTMPNGERIQFGTNVNFIFETDHLRFASPATISRLNMIFLSEEDIDVKPLVSSWIYRQPESIHGQLESWCEELFYKALDWVYKSQKPFSVETTRMGMVSNVLNHMSVNPEVNPTYEEGRELTKKEFILAVCRGLGGNLSDELRADLCREVFRWAGESLPDTSRPLNAQVYDGMLSTYEPGAYETDVSLEAVQRAGILPPLVPTVSVLMNMDLFRRWLADEQPFIVCGPEGCGKNLLIKHAIARLQSETDLPVSIATLHCNAQTSSRDVLLKLRQFCSVSTGNSGKVYRPKEGRRLILYMKDINLATPDKYDTSEIIMFLQQAVMHKGFYDDDLEFVQLEHIQVIASVAPSSTLGRHHIATRFTAIVRVCSITYPSMQELVEIYTQLLGAALKSPNYQNIDHQAVTLAPKIAEAMIDIYDNMKKRFTVDDHEHYLFSPRDLTLWVLQMMQYEVESVDALLEVWAYEANRIFRDRLVGEDQVQFDSFVRNALMSYLGSGEIIVENLCYTSLLAPGDEGLPSGLMKKIEKSDYKKMVEDGLVSYQREVKDLPIELVTEVLDHIACIDRALAAPLMNDILIVGRSGGGRRSAVSLISHMFRFQVFSPAPSRKYGDKEWKRDLKQVMQMTGVEKQPTVFFLEDHHMLSSSFLESINSLLSAGDVPGIWTNEELEPILGQLKDEWAASQGRGGGARTPFEYFQEQVKTRLRIVLSMDAKHPHFLPYCAANPALFSCTTVMWQEEWSTQSKTIICQQMLGEIVADKKANIGGLLLHIHESQREQGACPRHFITLLQACKAMYDSKILTSSGQSTHLQKGLEKLQEVSQTVEQLKVDAQEQEKKVTESKKLADEALQRITVAMQKSAERRQEVEVLEGKTKVEQDKNEEEKQAIETELAEIQPILDQAKKAVGSIKPDHLNEIRALKMPPEPIHDVLSGVLRLMGNHDNSWASMKKFLAGSGAITRILNFDPRQISEDIRKGVEQLLQEKANSFDHATIYRVSVAAAPLAKWVVACVRFSSVLVKVGPMERKLTEKMNALQASVDRLAQYKSELVEIDETVVQLKEEFQARTSEAEVLKVALERAKTTLQKADHLMSKMSGERDRWQLQTREIQRDAELLSTYTTIAAAYCTYLGQYSEDYRGEANRLWTSSCGLESYDILKVMTSESELLTWKAQGLSADRLSQENAVMIKFGSMVPFIVDPNSQVSEWLKQHATNAEIVLQQDPKLVSQLELAVRFGKTIIIQEVDGIENFLFPLLRRDLVRMGPRQVVQIGEKACDYNEGFNMYLCTRNSNAIDQLPPNAACLVTRISFSVTRAGLEGQLLGATLKHEKPELEHRKSELLQKEEQLKVELADLEKQLLTALADASGNILENEPLIQTLEGTKSAASTISESLVESSRLQVDLDNERDVYRPLATLGSHLFILIRELPVLDHMYRFSLESFMVIFGKVLKLQLGSQSIEDKLRQLGNQLKIMVLFYLSRSLFKADRLTFGMHMVRGIMPEKFEPNEWELFQGTYIPPSMPSAPAPTWCPQDRAQSLQTLRAAFPKIDDMWQLSKDSVWQAWVMSDKCEEAFDPGVYSRMTSFQRVLLVQAVRPDRLESALVAFACEALGVNSLSPPPLSLPKLHSDETHSKLPILFITTPGADPSQELEEFANKYAEESKPGMNFHQIAMGGGQNDDAIRVIQEAARNGDWVCLKNLHLVISWVPLLEKELKSLEPHENFRCWLTTEPHAKFPPILLETALKVTYEAPPGVKKNMLRTLESWSPSWFGSGSEVRSQVIFLCAHFHAIMQERRTYIPQGWTKFYEFSQNDLQSACETVSLLVKLADKNQKPGEAGIDWTTLIGVLEQAIYGSRVDNDFDSRLVKEYLRMFFNTDTISMGRKKTGVEIPPFDIPASTTMSEYRARVESMSDIDNPASFGMAPNADRSLQRINSTKAIAMLRQLAASMGGGHGSGGAGAVMDIKAWKGPLAPLFQLWDTVSKSSLSKLRTVEVRQVSPEDPPVVAFLLMDAMEAGKLGDLVTNSLTTMQKVIAGTALSTPDIVAEAMALMRSEVPRSWTATWPSAPEDPAVFLQGLAKRIEALKGEWVKRVASRNPLEGQVVLSDFLRPDVFLNALRQQTARALKISIDSLHLVSTFEPGLLDPSGSPLPVAVSSLILEGCIFDGRTFAMTEGQRNSALVSVLPPMTISWMSRETHPSRVVTSSGSTTAVSMPIYVSLSREQLIGEVMINTDSSRQRVLNSAALFLTESAT